MPGVPTAQPYGSDLPGSFTAGGGGGRGFSGVCFPCFSSLTLPSISSLNYGRALSGEREMLWQRQAHTRRAGARGRGAEGVLAAPRAELLNPGHRQYSWLI